MLEKVILESVEEENPDFDVDGYICLCILFSSFSISNWITPSIISLIGPRLCIAFGSMTFALYIASFFYPIEWVLYLMSFLMGVGAACLWTGQGNYLTLISTFATIQRNMSIFWVMYSSSLLIGSMIVYFEFRSKEVVDSTTRFWLVAIFSTVAVIGCSTTLLLRKPPPKSEDDALPPEVKVGPLEALIKALKLFITRDMLLLNVAFFYSGLAFSFCTGVYESCLGFTKVFPDRKELVGLSGIFIGAGNIFGGVIFGLLKTNLKTLHIVLTMGMSSSILGYLIIVLMLPKTSPFGETTESPIVTMHPQLTNLPSFLFGLGHACYNVLLSSTLILSYANNSPPAFAIFQFVQSVGIAASFGYSSQLNLYFQIGLLIFFVTLGSALIFYLLMVSTKLQLQQGEPT
ncbi:UNC93-like protein MFSD11 [Aethina tumida]|uniref:UNC93-like protein MFSD11 n=1 Tax=Aethina tumida TaxID=116153 RepID=UPI0021473491|nr:UNC93-like protein MFSD11 [Aethina tumida]